MILQNEICEVHISIDTTYTVESTDNRHYDIVLNPFHKKHNDFYTAFGIKIDLFYENIDLVLIGDFTTICDDCALIENNVLTVLINDAIVQIDVKNGTMICCKEVHCVGETGGIYRVQNGYLVLEEYALMMLDFEFKEKWSFTGKERFCIWQSPEFSETSIRVQDIDNHFYEVDYMD